MSKNQILNKIRNGLTKGMVNAYVCQDLHTIITKNDDNGHIPDKIFCPKCDKPALSMYYQVNQTFSPQVVFFKPSESETKAATLNMSKEDYQSHIQYLQSGGLVSRLVEDEKFTS